MKNRLVRLPLQVGDGLVLRWATKADTEAIAEFNFQHHNDNPQGQSETWLKIWTRQLLNGQHPTTGPDDVTVVEDPRHGNKVVSSATLISQTWTYDGIHFGCGRPELIATEPSYRRKGLVRMQMEVLHSRSQAKGELVQAITGIPWYYRQFGYEMTVVLGGSRQLPFEKVKPLPEGKEESYRLRPAKLDDRPQLKDLYTIQCAASLISCVRDNSVWRYELSPASEKHVVRRTLQLIEDRQRKPVGYIELNGFPSVNSIREMAVFPGHSLRDVVLFVARRLKTQSRHEGDKPQKPVTGLTFRLGLDHPVYRALQGLLTEMRPPYSWFMRVQDLGKFLSLISPVLDKRLNASVMTGYSGLLRLNFYRNQLALKFVDGQLATIESYDPKHFFDGDAYFPDLTFLQLLFGYRSLEELKYARNDCFTQNDKSGLLLDILFPKKHSHIMPLA